MILFLFLIFVLVILVIFCMTSRKEGIRSKKTNRKRQMNKRYKYYLDTLTTFYNNSKTSVDNSVSNDYFGNILKGYEDLYVKNNSIVNRIWGNVKPYTRTYLKEKWTQFNVLKTKILNDINNRKIKENFQSFNSEPFSFKNSFKKFKSSTLRSLRKIESDMLKIVKPKKTVKWRYVDSTNCTKCILTTCTMVPDSFELPTEQYSANNAPTISTSDFAKEFYKEDQKENFTDLLWNSKSTSSINDFVKVYDEYADSAYFKNNDKIDKLFKKIEKKYFRDKKIFKKVIDNLDTVILEYINKNLNLFYKILNTIPKTEYGKILIA